MAGHDDRDGHGGHRQGNRNVAFRGVQRGRFKPSRGMNRTINIPESLLRDDVAMEGNADGGSVRGGMRPYRG
jgi:hypothetical protein